MRRATAEPNENAVYYDGLFEAINEFAAKHGLAHAYLEYDRFEGYWKEIPFPLTYENVGDREIVVTEHPMNLKQYPEPFVPGSQEWSGLHLNSQLAFITYFLSPGTNMRRFEINVKGGIPYGMKVCDCRTIAEKTGCRQLLWDFLIILGKHSGLKTGGR